MLSDFTSLNVWSQLNLVFTWTLVLYVTKATNMKIDDLHDLPWPRSTSVWFGEGDLDISCIVFCHITITQIWFDKKKYLGKKVYIQYLRMISRYLYNLQIYNVLILVSLSIEENLVCSQARWGWIFLARPRIVRFPSVISLHLSRDLTANILEFWLLTSRVAAWTGVSYHWISPISSSPQWCPGSAPAWRPPGCRERECVPGHSCPGSTRTRPGSSSAGPATWRSPPPGRARTWGRGPSPCRPSSPPPRSWVYSTISIFCKSWVFLIIKIIGSESQT